jgi:Mrp family chromosome partitioning ATPase
LHTDVILLVIRPGCSSTRQMASAVSSLDESRLLGAVLNRVAS